jgi:hypothetical protein
MQPSCDDAIPGLREPLIISALGRYFKLKYLTLKLVTGNKPGKLTGRTLDGRRLERAPRKLDGTERVI